MIVSSQQINQPISNKLIHYLYTSNMYLKYDNIIALLRR